MSILLGAIRWLMRRLWRLLSRSVTIVVQPPADLLRRLGERAAAGVPGAVGRHRERAREDESYAHQVGSAVAALITTLVDSAPYASLLIVLVTTWLGTATSEVEETPIPGRISLTARVKDQQERSLAKDPIPLWDRYPFE